MTKHQMVTSVIASVTFLLGMLAGAFVQSACAGEPYQVRLESKTTGFVRDKEVEVSIMSTTTYRAVYTNRLARTDFIGSIKNISKTKMVKSVGIEVYVFDTLDNEKEIMWEYVGTNVMWVDIVLGPGESKQFKQYVEYDPTLDVSGKPQYSFGILGVVR